MTNKERIHKNLLYIFDANEPETKKLLKAKFKFLNKFNSTRFEDFKKREKIARKYFAKVGNNPTFNKPIYIDYGSNIYIGDNFYNNYNLTILDVNDVIIGNNVFIAPNVSIYTAGHPIDKDVRNKYYEYGYKVVIGNDVWIGGDSVINPGVKIGDNIVIGSNSVVTHDLPSNTICAGNPCKVIRYINDDDKKYWEEEVNKVLAYSNNHK